MRRILVVDDERKIRDLYKKLLTFQSYDVLEAENSRSATHLLVNEKDLELVLLDINMPMGNGGALYNVIRMYNSDIKVIVTSSYPLEDQKRKIIMANDYYDKSQGTETLLEKIGNAFGGEIK